MRGKYTYSIHQSGYITIKNLFGQTIATIDYDEHLSFSRSTSSVIREEVKDFLNSKDIPYIV